MFRLLPLLLLLSCSSADLDMAAKILQENANQDPTRKEIAMGLKETLNIGFSRAVDVIAKKDGFLKNAQIKIPIPKDVQKITGTLTKIGFRDVEPKMERLINRSAEQATGVAKDVFVAAISDLTLNDVMNILMGDKDAATEYLKTKTSNSLVQKFKPIVYKSLNDQGAMDYYVKIAKDYNRLPFVKQIPSDPTRYVTDRALSGIFISVAKEEALIRENPLQRSTDLIKKIFNYADKKRAQTAGLN